MIGHLFRGDQDQRVSAQLGRLHDEKTQVYPPLRAVCDLPDAENNHQQTQRGDPEQPVHRRVDPVIKRRVRQKLEVIAEEQQARDAPTDADLAGYRVYRTAPGAPRERIAEVGTNRSAWLDETARRGVAYAYTVAAFDQAGNEGAPAEPVEASLP